MKLYDYWRSTAAYRVRIALNLKGLAYEHIPVSLVADGGENLTPEFRAINPQGKIPALDVGEGVLGQSLAIIEYLDELHPEPALLPTNAFERAQARSFALTVACELHAVNNLAVMKRLASQFDASAEQSLAWMTNWMGMGFQALEEGLRRRNCQGPYVFGDTPTIADIFLVPQFYNARRWGIDLEPYPLLCAADEAARALPTFKAAAPEAQPDAES